MMQRYAITACLLAASALSIAALVSGSAWLELRIAGGLPVGNLVAAVLPGGLAGAAVTLSPATGAIRRLAQLVLAAALAWLPVSLALAGNLSLDFANGRGEIWHAFTAAILLASFLMLATTAVLHVVSKSRRGTSA